MNDNLPLLVEQEGGYCISYLGRNLLHPRTPIKSVLNKTSKVELQENCIYLVPSPLLGYGLDDLLQKLPDNSLIVGLESDPHLWDLRDKIPIAVLEHPGFKYFLLKNIREVEHIFQNLPLFQFRKVQSLFITGGGSLNRSFYQNLEEEFKSKLQRYWKNKMTRVRMGHLWMRNVFRNLSQLPKSRSLSELQSNKPVVILGAGESLEEAITPLKQNRNKVFILAVDTALGTLMESSITPDAVIAIEGQLYNLLDFYGYLNKKIPIIGDLTSHYSVIEKTNGPIYMITSKFHPLNLWELLKKKNMLPLDIPPMGSVGVAALWLGRQISPGPYFVAGLDFAYTPGKPHAKGSPGHKLSLHKSNRFNPAHYYKEAIARPLSKAMGKKGELVSTDTILEGYHKTTMEALRLGGEFYDLTTSGLDLGLPRAELSDLPDIAENRSQEKILPMVSSQDILAFYREHKSQLVQLIANLRSGKTEEVFLALEAGLDYLYCFFPDEQWQGQYPAGFLNRLLASAVFFNNYLDIQINNYIKE